MSDTLQEQRREEYFIQLPIQQAIEVRDELEASIWEIASQEQTVKETLEQADFDVVTGKPFIDPHTIITVVFTYIITKTGDKLYDETTDKVWEILVTKILPGLKKKFGENVLKKKDKNENDK